MIIGNKERVLLIPRILKGKPKGELRLALESLDSGESIEVTISEQKEKNRIAACVAAAKEQLGRKFSIRKTSDTTVRIFRVA